MHVCSIVFVVCETCSLSNYTFSSLRVSTKQNIVDHTDHFRHQHEMIPKIFWISSLLFLLFEFLFLFKTFSATVKRHSHYNCGNHRKVFSPGSEDPPYGVISNFDNSTFTCEWLISTANLNSSTLKYINIRIISIDFNCQSDTLYIFDGNSYEDKLVASFSGTIFANEQLFVSSGHLFVLQYSDFSHELSNFIAEYSITECPLNCSSHGKCENNQCTCDPYWTGVACQTQLCPNNCSYSGHCSQVPVTDSCYTQSDHYCECLADYIGQACDIVKTEYFNHKDLFQWKVLFQNEQYFSGRASHSSVYDPNTDTLFTYGGRNYETIFGDLISYSFTTNKWHNLTKCDKAHSFNNSSPRPLWGHTLNIFNTFLILFGGIFSNGAISNELWVYDIVQRRWSMKATKSAQPIAGLVFHTSTIVDHEWMYVHGGRLQNGLYSSDLFRINLIDGLTQWQLISNTNHKTANLQLVGHTAVFYPPLRSIVYFGGISLSQLQQNQLNNRLHLYNVDQNVWSHLVVSPSEPFLPSARVFHTTLLIDNYLLIFGGFTLHDSNNINLHQVQCQDNQIYLYCFTCHKWVDFNSLIALKTSVKSTAQFPFNGLYSHTLIKRNNLLIVSGGFSSHIHNTLLVNTFPRTLSQVELCSQIDTESTCRTVSFCYWCSRTIEYFESHTQLSQCLHRELKCSDGDSNLPFDEKCSGLCPRFDDCHSCLSYHISEG